MLLQMFAPFIPHITEKLFQMFFVKASNQKSLHLTFLDIENCSYDFEQQAYDMDLIVDIVAAVRKLKSEANLSLKTEIEVLSFDVSAVHIKKYASLVCGVTKAKKIEWVDLQIEESKVETDDSGGIRIFVKVNGND